MGWVSRSTRSCAAREMRGVCRKRWAHSKSRSWYRHSRQVCVAWPLLRHLNGGNEILGITKTGTRDPAVLVKVDGHSLAETGVELGSGGILGNREGKFLRHSSRHR